MRRLFGSDCWKVNDMLQGPLRGIAFGSGPFREPLGAAPVGQKKFENGVDRYGRMCYHKYPVSSTLRGTHINFINISRNLKCGWRYRCAHFSLVCCFLCPNPGSDRRRHENMKEESTMGTRLRYAATFGKEAMQ